MVEESVAGMVEGVIEALADKHSQVDLHLEHLTLNMAGTRLAVELNGTVTIGVHMRELSPREKEALGQYNIALHTK